MQQFTATIIASYRELYKKRLHGALHQGIDRLLLAVTSSIRFVTLLVRAVYTVRFIEIEINVVLFGLRCFQSLLLRRS